MNQMTTQWLDKLGNAGMIATEPQAADVYGLIAMVQFARHQLKAAVTEDFVSYSPINSIEQLEDLSLALNTSV